jgi:hypothetical protein
MADQEIREELGSRPMPDFVKRGLVRVKNGGLYLKAPYRVLWMREEHPDWSIVTTIEYADYEKGFAVVRAVIMDGSGRVLATAHSEESRGALPYVKKAEMGAIARALGLCGYGTQFGELDDEEFADSPQAAETGSSQAAAGNGKCPECKCSNGNPGPWHGPNCSRRKASA